MRNILVFLGGVAVFVIVAVGLYQWLGGPSVKVSQPEAVATAPKTAGHAKKVHADDFVIGSKTAPVTVIDYASLTCPHCARFHAGTLPKVKKEYVDKGKVRLVYRDFPLDSAALRASMLARCAGRERFFGFLDILFTRQQIWAGSQDPIGALSQIAALGGMNKEQFAACLKDTKIEKQVLEQRMNGENAFSIRSTPSFVVNGRLVSGALTFEEFKAIVDPLIAKAGK
jgi:protein-disulfide isomerase